MLVERAVLVEVVMRFLVNPTVSAFGMMFVCYHVEDVQEFRKHWFYGKTATTITTSISISPAPIAVEIYASVEHAERL